MTVLAEVAGLRVEAGSDGIAHAVIDNPPNNLLQPLTMDALREGLLRCSESSEVRAVVLTGIGDVFCGGLDVATMLEGGDPRVWAGSAAALLRIFPGLSIPVVAAVRGDALALGYGLVCACDVAITIPSARLGTFEAKDGRWPMIAQVPALQRLNPRHALENILTGIPFSAARAYEIGIVNEVAEPELFEERLAYWTARVLVAGPSLAAGRKTFYSLVDKSYDDALTSAYDAFLEMFS